MNCFDQILWERAGLLCAGQLPIPFVLMVESYDSSVPSER